MTIKLYDYQRQAVAKMVPNQGFLLADEMGLGKTYVALGEMHGGERYLIIAPKSAHGTWERAIHEMLDGQSIIAFDGQHKARFRDYEKGFCIVNSEALRVVPALAEIQWDYIVADEAHVFKNRKAKRTRALKKIKGNHRRALTGTPVINDPMSYGRSSTGSILPSIVATGGSTNGTVTTGRIRSTAIVPSLARRTLRSFSTTLKDSTCVGSSVM